jgi:hypothetical protein
MGYFIRISNFYLVNSAWVLTEKEELFHQAQPAQWLEHSYRV